MVQGMKQHLVGAACVGGQPGRPYERHVKPVILYGADYFRVIGCDAYIGVSSHRARLVYGVAYQRLAAQGTDVLVRNALAAAACRYDYECLHR